MPGSDISDIKIYPKSIVCEDSQLRGDITISSGCAIHPSATILAEAGPIILGENCIVEEYSTIVHRIPSDHPLFEEGKTPTLTIGPNNVFEVGCRVEAYKIGEKNVFECKSYVSPYVSVSSGCIIGAGCSVEAKQDLPENTVIYGKGCHQREAIEKQGSQTLQIDFLRKVLPNYHHLRKANYDPKKARAQI